MAAHVFARPIRVWSLAGRGALSPVVLYGEEYGEGGAAAAGLPPPRDAMHLLWSGAHYDLLIAPPSGGAATAA